MKTTISTVRTHFLFILLSMLGAPAFAQNCNCNYTIDTSTIFVDGNKLKPAPGSVICIQAGRRQYLKLINFQGTANA